MYMENMYLFPKKEIMLLFIYITFKHLFLKITNGSILMILKIDILYFNSLIEYRMIGCYIITISVKGVIQ